MPGGPRMLQVTAKTKSSKRRALKNKSANVNEKIPTEGSAGRKKLKNVNASAKQDSATTKPLHQASVLHRVALMGYSTSSQQPHLKW